MYKILFQLCCSPLLRTLKLQLRIIRSASPPSEASSDRVECCRTYGVPAAPPRSHHWRPGDTPLAAHTWTHRLQSLRASIPCAARVSPSILGRSGARRRLAWSPPASLIDNYVDTFLHTVFQLSAVVHSLSCTYHVELPTRWRSVINFPATLPSAIKDISIQKILPRCYSVLAFCLRCRGLRDSSAVKATLKNFWLTLIDIDIVSVALTLASHYPGGCQRVVGNGTSFAT